MPNVGAIWGSIGMKTTELKRGLNDAEKQIKGFVGSTKSAFKGLLVGAASLAGIGFSVKKAFDFAEVGANIDKQREAFKNLSASVGADSDQLLNHLNEVSRGTVSNMDLIASASRAMLLGIAPERLTELLSIARAASKATGDSVTKSFNDIAIGIGRQSKLILDNLGIIVSVEQANEKYARTLNKTASDLTDAEQRQAFLNATLEAGRKIINRVGTDYDSTSDTIDRTKVAFTELKIQISGIFTTLSSELLPKVTETVTAMHEWIKANKLLIDQRVSEWVNGIGNAISKLAPALRALSFITEKVAEGYKGLIELYLFSEKLPSLAEQEILNIQKETKEIQNQIEIKKKRLTLAEKELQVVMDSRRLELPELDILPEGYGRQSFNTVTEAIKENAEEWEKVLKHPFQEAIEKVKELRILLDSKLINEDEFNRGITDINLAFIEAQESLKETREEAKRVQNGITQDMKENAEEWGKTLKLPITEAIEKVKELRGLLNKNLINEDQFNRGIVAINLAFNQAQKSLEQTRLEAKRVKSGLEDLDREVQYKIDDFELLGNTTDTVFDDMKNAVNGWADDFSRTMTDMLFGAEVTFESIAKSFAKMITQMLLQKTVVEPLMSSFFSVLSTAGLSGGIGGGFGSFFSGLFRGGAGKGNPLVGMTAAGGGSSSFLSGLLPFADGGIVPGIIGTPVPIMAHAGEIVLPIKESKQLISKTNQTKESIFNMIGGITNENDNPSINNTTNNSSIKRNIFNYDTKNNFSSNNIPTENKNIFNNQEYNSNEIIKSFLKTIPAFAEGGIVPGVIGTPVPIIAHAGEKVLPINRTEQKEQQPLKVQVILNNPIDPRMFQKSDEEVVTVVADHYSRGSIITEVIRRDIGGGG